MTKFFSIENSLLAKAERDHCFRKQLVESPKTAIEAEFGVELAPEHEIHVHEQSYSATHLVLPPLSKFTESEKQEFKTGSTSLAFLRKTMHDPAPPPRSVEPKMSNLRVDAASTNALVTAARESIARGLGFLESAIDANGAWHCIRSNLANPEIPRHFEKPPFISGFCALALAGSSEPRAQALCMATRAHLVNTIEYPGLWRYYLHLPPDLDSTTLCSMALGNHPWIVLGRNIAPILANRDEEGCFLTWILEDDEPDVVPTFRIEADPVVNANVIAYLGDQPETTNAQIWIKKLLTQGSLANSSKWYHDPASIYYAIARAVLRVRGQLDSIRPLLASRIKDLQDQNRDFSDVFQVSQAVSALHRIGHLRTIDTVPQMVRLIDSQREDGSWPELLAFGDQSLQWGTFGQIGHGSEVVTSAFCIEALECLVESMQA